MGEITLRGRVLPIERMVERLAAAGRAGIRRVIVPERNRRDVLSVREPAVLEGLDIAYVGSIDEAFDLALPDLRPQAASAKE